MFKALASVCGVTLSSVVVTALDRYKVLGKETASANYGPILVRVAEYPRLVHLPLHCHSEEYVTFVSSGGYTERTRREARECVRGSVLLHDAGEVHEDAFGNRPTRCVNLFIDPCWRSQIATEDLLGAGLIRASALTCALIHRVENELRAPDDVTPLVLQSVILELGVLRRRELRSGPAWLRDARAFINEHFAARITLRDVGDAVGAHPAQVARAFRAYDHVSVGEQIRRARIEYACQQLRSKRPLAMIACEAGFADQSHFTRTFRRLMGTTPAAYRRSLRMR